MTSKKNVVSEKNYNQQTTTMSDEYKDVPPRNPYSHRKLRPLPDTDSVGTISPDWRSITPPHHIEYYVMKKLNRIKYKKSASSDIKNNEIIDNIIDDDRMIQSNLFKNNEASSEDSHNDEEKAYAPSHPANNPYLFELYGSNK